VTRNTFHLVPEMVWMGSDPGAPYRAATLETDGFIHCTDGAEEVLRTGTRHFRADPREYVALTVDLDRTGSPWRFDAPSAIYPHVYGPIARDAIVAVARVRRDADGAFIAIDATGDAAS